MHVDTQTATNANVSAPVLSKPETVRQTDESLLLTAIDSVMVTTDANGNVQRWNARAAETFDIEPRDAIGRPFTGLPIKWSDEQGIHDLLDEKTENARRVELNFVDPKGETRVFGFSSYRISEHGEFNGYLMLGAELTETRILEQQLHNAQKLESVGQLAAGVAHEINTPMQYIGDNLSYVQAKFENLIPFLEGTLKLLEKGEVSTVDDRSCADLRALAKKLKLQRMCRQIPEALNDSIEGVSHVSRIVRAMKELSHPGCEDKIQVDVNHSLESTMTVSTNEWKYVAEVETDFEKDLDSIVGFPGQLNQVFLNLIINAAHAIAERVESGHAGMGKIILRSRKQGDWIRVEIADTGGGIPADIRERVFDPFFTTKAVGKGTGQGLAIAHSVIVQKHGGKLNFSVEEGVGTTFVIELPIKN